MLFLKYQSNTCVYIRTCFIYLCSCKCINFPLYGLAKVLNV